MYIKVRLINLKVIEDPPNDQPTTSEEQTELNPAVETEIYDVSEFVEQIHAQCTKKKRHHAQPGFVFKNYKTIIIHIG